jgi:nicotinamidase-related amidase
LAPTVLDPGSALIVIDLQVGVVAVPVVHPIDDVIQRTVELADAFRRHSLPVVLVNVAGRPPGRTESSPAPAQSPGGSARFADGWTELVPALNQQPSDHLVTKMSAGAFTNTGLDGYLKSRGVTQVVIVGVATSSGVESTARQAYEHGFNVTLAVDAMTDRSLDAHVHSVTRLFPLIAETGSTAEVLKLLSQARP